VFLKNGKEPGATVSTPQLFLVSILVPSAIALVSCGLSVWHGRGKAGYSLEHAVAEFNTVIFGFLLIAGTVLPIVELFKRFIGCPRPNFYALGAIYDYDSSTYSKWGTDRYKNVPSGHASISLSFTLYTSFYLNAKLKAYLPASRKSATYDTIRLFAQVACYLPTVFGLWICSTRLVDFWHSNAAVALGMILGGVCSLFCWEKSGAFYLPRIWGIVANQYLPKDAADLPPVKAGDLEDGLRDS
jgi:membrane-associated phospholipid phosphatase